MFHRSTPKHSPEAKSFLESGILFEIARILDAGNRSFIPINAIIALHSLGTIQITVFSRVFPRLREGDLDASDLLKICIVRLRLRIGAFLLARNVIGLPRKGPD